MTSRVEHIGDAELWLGDCRKLLPELRADVMIADPPCSEDVTASPRSTHNAVGDRLNG